MLDAYVQGCIFMCKLLHDYAENCHFFHFRLSCWIRNRKSDFFCPSFLFSGSDFFFFFYILSLTQSFTATMSLFGDKKHHRCHSFDQPGFDTTNNAVFDNTFNDHSNLGMQITWLISMPSLFDYLALKKAWLIFLTKILCKHWMTKLLKVRQVHKTEIGWPNE